MPISTIAAGTWVIVPAYNEARYISTVLKKILPHTKQVIVVDDGSTDDTYAMAKSQVDHVLKHAVNLGKGSALKTGAEYAFIKLRARAVIFLDSDDQHDPAEIPAFIKQLERGNTIVLGVRKLNKQMPFMRKLGSRILSKIVHIFFGTYVPDILSGYKAIAKPAYEKLKWYSRTYGIEMEIAIRIARYKMPYSEVPIKTIYHDFDRGMTLLDFLEMIVQLLTWRIFL